MSPDGTSPADAPDTRWHPSLPVRLCIWLHILAIPLAVARPGLWPWLLGVLLGSHLMLGIAGMWPRSQIVGANLVRLPQRSSAKNHVALTFDDGPDPDVTPMVLDLLDRYAAKASFFCIGERAAAHPDVVRDIIRRGHSVENHSYRHPYAFACYSPAALRREVARTQIEIQAITGRSPTFFRAPMGLRSPLLDLVMARSRLRYVSWTRRGLDSVSGNPTAVLRRLLRGLAAGDVLLLHDGACAKTASGVPVVLAVLPSLLAQLAQRGLRPVSLPQACADA